MPETIDKKIKEAKHLLNSFAERTGISENGEKQQIRYLWTDAFAVQAFFGLSHIFDDEMYNRKALGLIDLVHETLGRFHPKDKRKGPISGLPESKAKEHPTINGLRIGKNLPERGTSEAFNEQLEWERDGQYFHYLSRWFVSLLEAGQETGSTKYSLYATELLKAGGKFFTTETGQPGMYWKMSTDLSRPLIKSMGAQDPMEGLICAKSLEAIDSGKFKEIEEEANLFAQMCAGRDWSTSDALGIGGLLLNTLRSAQLANENIQLPASINPQKLMKESLYSLQAYALTQRPGQSANRRLAFRECGLSLGVRALFGRRDSLANVQLDFNELEKYLPLADQIEDFWLDPDNQKAVTWQDHLDINTVSLAASLVASKAPEVFAATGK